MSTRILNLMDDHRQLHLQHRQDDPQVLHVLLFVRGRKLVFAYAEFRRCRFSDPADELLFWVGPTNFTVSESEREEIEEFLAQCLEATK